METRRFGRTGHMSTVAIFGAAALSQVTQEEADKAMEQVIEALADLGRPSRSLDLDRVPHKA